MFPSFKSDLIRRVCIKSVVSILALEDILLSQRRHLVYLNIFFKDLKYEKSKRADRSSQAQFYQI